MTTTRAEPLPNAWIRALLRFALRATSDTTSISAYAANLDATAAGSGPDLTNPEDPGKDPRFRALVEQVLFSRRFLVTYNGVLLVLLLGFTLAHWWGRWRLSKRGRYLDTTEEEQEYIHTKRVVEELQDEPGSSGSSTLEGTATPPDATKKVDEELADTTPLLGNKAAGKRNMPLWRRATCHIQSFLMYQPRPIPVVNKTLPSNATSIFVALFVLLNVFYCVYHIPPKMIYLFVYADRFGLVFVANLPLLYLLAAKNCPLRFLTGRSYESLNIFHRRVGEIVCAAALLHFLGMMGVWYGLLRRLGFSLGRFLLNKLILLGLGAFVSYELLYFTSLGSFRQRWYELFLALHVVLQVGALVFLWFHHHTSRTYVGVAAAIWVLDRIIWRACLRSKTMRADLTILSDNETVLVSADWDIPQGPSGRLARLRKRLFGADISHGWKPTDHVFLSLPRHSASQALQSHPFTIFSAAPPPAADEVRGRTSHAWLSLLVRPQQGFSRELLKHAQLNHSAVVRFDGPYGSIHALDMLDASDVAVVVAGGSGIAVAFPLVWGLLDPCSRRRRRGGVGRRKGSVHLVWVVHAPEHYAWVPEERMQELKEWGLQVWEKGPTVQVGRPDMKGVVQEVVAADDVNESGRVGVVVSGPDGMTRDVRNACASLVGRGQDVSVAVEKFGW